MQSPARRHFERHTAAAQGSQDPVQARLAANQYELMLAKLDEDRRRLHAIQSTERKIEVKRELLPDYAAWVDGVIEAATGQQDDVLMTIMLWRIDTGDFAGALQIGRYAIENDLTMPDRFKRDVACLLAEEIADTALRADADTQAGYVTALAECIAITAEADMPDEVRAKLYKAYGYALSQGNDDIPPDLEGALAALNRALQLHDKVGVKKDIEQIERELKKTQAQA